MVSAPVRLAVLSSARRSLIACNRPNIISHSSLSCARQSLFTGSLTLNGATNTRLVAGTTRHFGIFRIFQNDNQNKSKKRTPKDAALVQSTSGDGRTILKENAFNSNPQTQQLIKVELPVPGEKGAKAIRLNLRARLTKEKEDTRKWSSLREVWRLLRIARRETWPLTGAVSLLLISSAVTISVPLTIGKVMSKSCLFIRLWDGHSCLLTPTVIRLGHEWCARCHNFWSDHATILPSFGSGLHHWRSC